ncbi:MAG: alpha/beta fold hydrolase [Verrucomicrobiota bacterium]
MLTPANPQISCHGDVLLVHGIFDTGHVFTRIARALSAEGWNAYTPSMSPPNGSLSLDELARQIAEFMRQNEIGQNPDHPWILVGFSMGGLVSRALLQNHGVSHLPKALVTIGCPHHGSILTYFFWGRGTRDMRPTSRFLKKLKKSEDTLPSPLPCYSLWTPLDLMIIPSRSSLWNRACNEIHWAPLHPWLLISNSVIRRILEIASKSLIR